jgi:hypothetical protein
MNDHVPDYLVPYVLSGTAATVAAVLFGFHRALKLAGWPAQKRKRASWSGAVLLLAWCFASFLLSWFEFFRGSAFRLPTIQYGLLIPIIAGVVLFRRWPLAQRTLEAVPQEWLVSVQFYRILGLIFLVLYASGRAPGVFAWPAGVGDVIVGLLAPAVGIAYARRSRNAVALVRAWNLLGISDLIVAVTTGFLSSPSPLQLFAFGTPNELISQFPLAMIPVFLVPLSILLHLASLKKLRQTETRWQASASASG